MQRTKASFFRRKQQLSAVPAVDLDRLATRTEIVRVPRRGVLWQTGQPADTVYWLRSGIVKVSTTTPVRRDLTLRFHTKGDLFGEAALFSELPRATSAEAYEDAVVYATPVDEVLRLLPVHPPLLERVTRLITRHRLRLEARLGSLLFMTAQARLAALFLELAEDFGVRDSRGVIINLKLTHKEMAGLIGATRETVSFAILELRKAGLVQTEGKRVVLLRPDGLRAILSPDP